MDLKSSGASAAINVHWDGGRLLSLAFSRADVIEGAEISMPTEVVKREERVIVNSPDPEYASIRYLIGGPVDEEGGMM